MNYGLLNRCTIYLFIYFFWIDPFASFIIVAAGEMHFMMELINTMDNNNWRYIFLQRINSSDVINNYCEIIFNLFYCKFGNIRSTDIFTLQQEDVCFV